MGKPKDSIKGHWQIVSMTEWDDDYLNEEVEAFMDFAAGESGSFQFGYVQGEIDYRTVQRDGAPAVEFSWEGGDAADGTPLTGRGWGVVHGREMTGMIFIHCGSGSEFEAKKKK